jgi:ATP-dependent RNA helicase DeaD
MIEIKRNRITEHIMHILERESFDQYFDYAKELLSKGDPEQILASALKYTLKGELDPTAYRKIKETEGRQREDKVRLFLAKGKVDRYNPRKLVDFIFEETGVEGRKIQDIKIFENFSFFTAPYVEAELILEIFKKNKGSRKSLVERAKAHS